VAFDLAGGSPVDKFTAFPAHASPTSTASDSRSPSSLQPSRSATLAGYVSNAFSSVSGAPKETRLEKARRLAHDAEVKYREFMKDLDHQRYWLSFPFQSSLACLLNFLDRLMLEEHLSGLFGSLQKWELERLRNVKAGKWW
jgi:hypothetical protein